MELSKIIILAMLLWCIAVIEAIKNLNITRLGIKARVYVKALVINRRFEKAIRSVI